MYPSAKADGFSLRGSSRENFRRHYGRPCVDRPLPDDQRCVDIRVGFMPIRDTFEAGLIGSVLLVDAAARDALARRIMGDDVADRDSGILRFVGDETFELGECPITKPRSLVAAGRSPAADAVEFSLPGAATPPGIFLPLEAFDQITVGAKALISCLGAELDDVVVEFVIVIVDLSLNASVTIDVIDLECMNVVSISTSYTSTTKGRNGVRLQTKPQRAIQFEVLREISIPVPALAGKTLSIVSDGIGGAPCCPISANPLCILPIIDLITTERLGFHMCNIHALGEKGNSALLRQGDDAEIGLRPTAFRGDSGDC
jgi:hypothetical protein